MNRINPKRRPKKRPSKKSLAGRANFMKRYAKKLPPTVVPEVVQESCIPFVKIEDDIEPLTSTEGENSASTVSIRELSTFDEVKVTKGISNEYMLVRTDIWQDVLNNVSCKECGESDMFSSVEAVKGFASNVVMKCRSCLSDFHVSTSRRICSTSSSRPPFDVNKRVVDSFSSIGKGYAAFELFCKEMGMKSMCASSYSAHLQTIVKDGFLMKKQELKM